MNFKSLKNLADDVKAWSDKIDFDYDYIVGIPRSGILTEEILRAHTDKAGWPTREEDVALIVDDSLMSGKAMRQYRKLYKHGKFGAVYVKPGMENSVDTYYQVLPRPRIFEWNWHKSRHLHRTMIDIDGVLCRDPGRSECDYGERMLEFYHTVQPRVRLEKTAYAFVTCRLSKYRQATMDWLAMHNLDARHLIMRDTREQRHGEFKAQAYRNSNAILFIESSAKQAAEIARLSGKPVLCYSSMEMM